MRGYDGERFVVNHIISGAPTTASLYQHVSDFEVEYALFGQGCRATSSMKLMWRAYCRLISESLALTPTDHQKASRVKIRPHVSHSFPFWLVDQDRMSSLRYSALLVLRNQLRCTRANGRRWYSDKPIDPLRILFCGSDEFSIASLKALHAEQLRAPQSIKSIDVVCRPGKRVGRGLKQFREGWQFRAGLQ